MTPINRRASHRPAREARMRRSFDGVVASYIRELSAAGELTLSGSQDRLPEARRASPRAGRAGRAD
jgi:hypothetical protein